jgi:DNA-directed RNA polymerase specialized sigma24 family protein
VDAGGGHRVESVASEDEMLDRWEAFHTAVDGLPAEEREVVHLAWYMGVDQRTIADIARCGERTVRDRWRSGRNRLRAVLDGRTPG